MSKVRELIYMVLDEVKLLSDDAYYTEEHVMFLLGKYRAQVLKQAYSDIKKLIPSSNYQTICLNLEQIKLKGFCRDNISIKSVDKVPSTLAIGNVKVTPTNYFTEHINYISKDRMAYVGNNKWLQNIIYCAKSTDDYLYFKSDNPQHKYLTKVHMTAIFEDYVEASKMDCSSGEVCDEMDIDFPLEEGLVSTVLQLAVKDLVGAAYRPKDDVNNASDDLSDLAKYIAKNVKSNLQKQIFED